MDLNNGPESENIKDKKPFRFKSILTNQRSLPSVTESANQNLEAKNSV